jgi:hypothetical protein
MRANGPSSSLRDARHDGPTTAVDALEPAGWRPLSWGLPAGWDVPIYSADLRGWVLWEATRHYGKLWPAAPVDLATAEDLAAADLRPRNALCPEAFLVGPAHVNGGPVSVDWSVLNADIDTYLLRAAEYLGLDDGSAWPEVEDRYPVRALYRRDRALPRDLPPTAVDRAEDRWDVAAWAQSVLADPDSVILEIGTIGDIDDPIDDPDQRAVLCEMTIRSTTGEPLLDTLINPTWPWLPAADLAKQQVTVTQLRAAPTFHHLRSTVAGLLRGRRVVCLDRARTYGVLFSALEWCAASVCDANGALRGDHEDMLNSLSSVRFACLRLARSRFLGSWDSRCRPRLIEGISEPARTADRAHAALGVLAAMARQAPGQSSLRPAKATPSGAIMWRGLISALSAVSRQRTDIGCGSSTKR